LGEEGEDGGEKEGQEREDDKLGDRSGAKGCVEVRAVKKDGKWVKARRGWAGQERSVLGRGDIK